MDSCMICGNDGGTHQTCVVSSANRENDILPPSYEMWEVCAMPDRPKTPPSNGRRLHMGDMWDYKLRKIDIAWELASRIIPARAVSSGAWTPDDFIAKAQEIMKAAMDSVDAVFKEDKAGPR